MEDKIKETTDKLIFFLMFQKYMKDAFRVNFTWLIGATGAKGAISPFSPQYESMYYKVPSCLKLVYKLFVSVTIAISVRNSLEDKSMLFNQLYLTQGHKLEAWFVLSESREYFSVEP